MLNNFLRKDKNPDQSDQWIFGLVLVFSLLALAASLALSIEKLHLLEHPEAKLSCSINAVLNCASVMKTPQASVLGFPNSFIGLMAFPIFTVFALGGLLKIRYPKPAILAFKWTAAIAVLFAYWLFFQSVYVIQILCPWCLLVTFSTTMIFAAIERYTYRENAFNFNHSNQKKIEAFLKKDYDKVFFAGLIIIMFILVYAQFGDALFS